MNQNSAKNILTLVEDDAMVEIFCFLGPVFTATCSQVCKQWYTVASDSRCLWRQFVAKDFRLDEGSDQTDWKRVYAYLAHQLQSYNKAERESKTVQLMRPLPATVIFCDDGSNVPGYPPECCLVRGFGAWCTNAGVEEDVDLVIELPATCLITCFEAANGGMFYSAPLKEALVFTSMHPINLDRARQYDGRTGSEWAKKLHANLDTGYSSAKPLVGFCFPPLPEAFSARLRKPLNYPVVARYVHFKLLSSHKATDGRLAGKFARK